MQDVPYHDETTGAAHGPAPAAIGTPRSASPTSLDRAGIVKPLCGVIGAAAVASGYLLVRTAPAAQVPHGDFWWALSLLPVVAAVIGSAAILLLRAASSGPVTTWVGDRGVAIGPRRILGGASTLPFGEVVTSVDLITSHAYDTHSPDPDQPRYLALLFKLTVRDARAKSVLIVEGAAPYREPGRYEDDDDRSPATFRHLSHDHPWWFARAVDAAWRAKDAA